MKGSMFSDTEADPAPKSPAPRIPRVHPAPAEASTDIGHDDPDADGARGLPGAPMALLLAILAVLAAIGAAHLVADLAMALRDAR